MSIWHVIKKEGHMNNLEKFNIYIKTKNYNQINDKNITSNNILFDVIIYNDVNQ